MSPPKLLVFAGSARRDSLNKKLAIAAAALARAAGADVTLIDLADYRIPLYDGDLESESGMPDNARKMRTLMLANDGFIIASPEYNSAISPLLKNVLDWVSRPLPDEPNVSAYRGKFATLLATSPGAFGGLRGLAMVRQVLMQLGTTVLPEEIAVGNGMAAFDAEGSLVNPKQLEMVKGAVERLVRILEKLQS